MEKEIPEDLKNDLIEDWKKSKYFGGYWPGNNYVIYEEAYLSGYTLASKEIEDLKKQHKESLLLYQNMCEQITKDQAEIDRLKGLIRFAHQWGYTRGQTANTTIESSWEFFQSKNNL